MSRVRIGGAVFPPTAGADVVWGRSDDPRPLYVGVAASRTIEQRWRRQHLLNRAGGSALRRSLGVYLGLVEKKLSVKREGRFYDREVDHSPGRDAKLLDPAVDAARVRAMYTNPAYARRGVGRLVLPLCEAAAAAEGFRRLELVATLSGEPLYSAYGFAPLERIAVSVGTVAVPTVRMEKSVEVHR